MRGVMSMLYPRSCVSGEIETFLAIVRTGRTGLAGGVTCEDAGPASAVLAPCSSLAHSISLHSLMKIVL